MGRGVRWIVVAAVALLSVGAVQGQTQKKVNELKGQKTTLQKKINKGEASLKQTEQSVKKKLGELQILNGQIEAQEGEIKRIEEQIDSIGKETARLEAEIEKLRKELEEKREKYRRSMLYLYNNRKGQNKLLFILSADGFGQMLRRYRYVTEYAKYQKVQGGLILKKEEQVREREAELQREKVEKEQMLQEHEAKKKELEATQAAQEKAVKSLKGQQQQLKKVLQADKKQMAELDKKIDYYVQKAIEEERKRREEEERRKAEEAKKAAAGKSSSSKTSGKKAQPMEEYGSEAKDYVLSQDFAANKGKLPVPITGSYSISAHFGNYNVKGLSGVQLDNKGINLTSRSQCQARAIFDGEVSAIFPNGGLMHVLIRHGSYISVYCNLQNVAVRKGQKVTTKQTIGSIAKDASGNYTLHFELRKERTVLNPESWVAK